MRKLVPKDSGAGRRRFSVHAWRPNVRGAPRRNRSDRRVPGRCRRFGNVRHPFPPLPFLVYNRVSGDSPGNSQVERRRDATESLLVSPGSRLQQVRSCSYDGKCCKIGESARVPRSGREGPKEDALGIPRLR